MRVLLVRLSALGDLAHSLSAVAMLHRGRPELELHLVTQRTFAPLLSGVPGLCSVVAHDRRAGAGGWLRTRRALRQLGCEIALDLQGNHKSALCAWLSGARERIGAAARWRQEPWSRVWLTRTVAVDGPGHPALVAASLARTLVPGAALLRPELRATAAEIEAAATQVRARGIAPEAPFRVLVAGASRDPRSQRSEQLAREVAAGSVPTLLLLGPEEAAVAAPAGATAWRQGPGELRLLVGLGALVARSRGHVVGPDRGATHVLAAAGAPTAVLFGPQDPLRTAPLGARVLQHPAPPSCMPCCARRCRHPDGPVCMAFASSEGREFERPDWLAAPAS